MAGEIDREMSSEQTLARWNANSLLELRGAAEPGRERDEVGFLAAAGKHARERSGEPGKDEKRKNNDDSEEEGGKLWGTPQMCTSAKGLNRS